MKEKLWKAEKGREAMRRWLKRTRAKRKGGTGCAWFKYRFLVAVKCEPGHISKYWDDLGAFNDHCPRSHDEQGLSLSSG